MVRRRKVSDSEFAEAVAGARSIRATLAAIGLRPAGGNYATARRRIASMKLDTTHFSGMGWRRGSLISVTGPIPLEQVLVEGRPTQSSDLRRRLLAAGLKDHECEVCRRRVWNGRPMPLELDHLNGRREDNRLDNLRLLCPNCHAQTSTYRGRNIGRSGGIL